MPATAVSVLQGHMIWSPTKLASIIEMCQRGTLRIEPVGTRVGFLYRLSRQGPTQYEWERTICDSLPPGPTTVDALDEAIDKNEDAIGDQIGDYLHQRGLFDDNALRVRRENDDDGGVWTLLPLVLTGVGSGFWAALWLDQWWASVLIGAFVGLAYSFPLWTDLALEVRTGMLTPTQKGAREIGQWLGWKETLTGPGATGVRGRPDSMMAYAVAFNVAQPWLDVSAPAPPWFGSSENSPPRGADLDAAYRGFLHAPEWWLTGRSGDAAKAAAQHGYEQELELLEQLDHLDLESPDAEKPEHTAHRGTAGEIEAPAREPESRRDPPAAPAASPSAEYQTYRSEQMVEEEKGGGRLRGCLFWVVSLLAIAALVLIVLFSLDVVSPRDKPCPLDSPPIPTPAQIAVAGDLFRDGVREGQRHGRVPGRRRAGGRDEKGRVRAAGERARPVGGPRSSPPGPRGDLGWAAQGGGGRNIRSPLRTGPWIGPGVVAEPPGEPRRVVLGGCVCDRHRGWLPHAGHGSG